MGSRPASLRFTECGVNALRHPLFPNAGVPCWADAASVKLPMCQIGNIRERSHTRSHFFCMSKA